MWSMGSQSGSDRVWSMGSQSGSLGDRYLGMSTCGKVHRSIG